MSLDDPILFLDGGLATELERAFGKDLSGKAYREKKKVIESLGDN